MYCKNCGMQNQDTAAYCPNCGVPMGVGLHFCSGCGTQTDGAVGSCPGCGAPLEGDNQQQYQQQSYNNPYNPPSGGYSGQQGYAPGANPNGYPNGGYPNNTYPTVYSEPKSRLVAGLLGIFVGTLGIHNFYLGYKTRGLWQLLLTLCTCGFLAPAIGIWALVEAILIFTGSIAVDGYGRPLKD